MKMKALFNGFLGGPLTTRAGSLVSVAAWLWLLSFPLSLAAAPSARVALCHLMKSGAERLIMVSAGQVQRHLDHGDRYADTFYADEDGDGFGAAATSACGLAPGLSNNNLDCNDLQATTNPDAEDVPFDATDNNCDGTICPSYNTAAIQTYLDHAATLPWGSLQCQSRTDESSTPAEEKSMSDLQDGNPLLIVIALKTTAGGNLSRLDFRKEDSNPDPNFPNIGPTGINDAELTACRTEIRDAVLPEICP